MKKNVIIIFIVGSLFMASKANAQVDSMKNLRDSIYNLKANYIGQPLSKLLNALKVDVNFAEPDFSTTRRKGAAYYQNITIFLPASPNFVAWAFEIKLANKVPVDLALMHQTIRTSGYAAWNKQVVTLLGSQNIISIKKF